MLEEMKKQTKYKRMCVLQLKQLDIYNVLINMSL